MKKILLITTGGTIACIKTSNGLIPHATPEELLNEVEVEEAKIEFESRLAVLCGGGIQFSAYEIG